MEDEDPWLLMPGRAPRLQTDSVVERASLRLSLEQNIRVVLDAQRLSALSKNEKAAPQPGTGGSSPAQKPVGTGATSLDGTWASEASSSFPATWASEAEEEAAEDAGGVVQDFAPSYVTLAAQAPAKVATMENPVASLQPAEDTVAFDQQVSNLNLSKPLKLLPANSSLEGKTTVMVLNVPTTLVQQKLMKRINAAGFLGKYDFFYLPMHPEGGGNQGFAFLNFKTAEAAEAFKLAFDGSRFKKHVNNSQPMAIVPASVQGFDENAAQYIGWLKSASAGGRRVPPAGHAPLFFRPLPPHLDDDFLGCGRSNERQHQQPEHAVACPKDQILQLSALLAPATPIPIAPAVWAAASSRIAQFCAYCGGRRSQDHRFCAFCGSLCVPLAGGLPQ